MEFWTAYLIVAAFCLVVGMGEAAWAYRHPETNDGVQVTYSLQDILFGVAACLLPAFNWVVAFGLCGIFIGFIAPKIVVFGPK